ncbi:cyanophycin synthetase [Glutamicibacter halophytocola]
MIRVPITLLARCAMNAVTFEFRPMDSATMRTADSRRHKQPTTAGSPHASSGAAGQSYTLDLAVPGQHNLLNATAALSVGMDAGLDVEEALAALASFSGAARRFELKGSVGGVRVYDDYAHHPTEVLGRALRRPYDGGGRTPSCGVPAPPVQPHKGVLPRVREGSFSCRLSGSS